MKKSRKRNHPGGRAVHRRASPDPGDRAETAAAPDDPAGRDAPPPADPAPEPFRLKRKGLAEEIDILRRTVRRLFDTAEGQDDEKSVRTLNILSNAAARLARLVETQARLPEGDQDDELTQAFLKAIAEICPPEADAGLTEEPDDSL
jgi:hypothetical protein